MSTPAAPFPSSSLWLPSQPPGFSSTIPSSRKSPLPPTKTALCCQSPIVLCIFLFMLHHHCQKLSSVFWECVYPHLPAGLRTPHQGQDSAIVLTTAVSQGTVLGAQLALSNSFQSGLQGARAGHRCSQVGEVGWLLGKPCSPREGNKGRLPGGGGIHR